MPSTTDDFQSALIASSLEEVRKLPCIICDRRPAVAVGIWTPTTTLARRLGAPDDKGRVVVYPLCKKCSHKPDIHVRAEEIILARPGSGGALTTARRPASTPFFGEG